MNNIKTNSDISNNNFYQIQKKSQIDYKSSFSKALENMKNGKPADYDEEEMKDQNIKIMTQIMSDGSTLVTIYDENGHIISQNRTSTAKSDSNAKIIGTEVEVNNFGLEELAAEGNINSVSLQ